MDSRERSDNITGHARKLAGIHTPTSVRKVIDLVKHANTRGTPLYPVSTGLNFGYGGSSPVVDGCHLVDLSAMDRILNADEISLDNPVAVIEPGVTQVQLYDFLESRCPGLTFNVTGSARASSIIGNALDRGVGYFGPRKEDLFGLEIVCGNAELIYTGFRGPRDKNVCELPADHPKAESALAHGHPYGLGPMLDGMFFQSNFGIVTSACFRLVPKHPRRVALSLSLRREGDLAAFIDALARLKREGLLTSVTHIGNRDRTHASLMSGITQYLEQRCGLVGEAARAEAERALRLAAPGEWSSLGAVTGTPAQVRASLAEIRRRTRHFARARVVTDGLLDKVFALTDALRFLPFARANAAAIAAVRPLHGLALGVPTDAAIDNLLWRVGRTDLSAAQLDRSRCGLLFVNPAMPLNGVMLAQVVRAMQAIARTFGHPLYMTINLETATSVVAVINLLFDRTVPAQIANAHACADALLAYVHSAGLEVYRSRADMMGAIVERDPAHWRLVRSLKQIFDPRNIIAPGRYNLP